MHDIKEYMHSVGEQARATSRLMGRADTAAKNRALLAIANRLEDDAQALIGENAKE